MSAIADFVFANSNQDFFGSSSPFGDPRTVFSDGLTDSVNEAVITGQDIIFQTSGIFVGSFGNDYLTAYNWTLDEVDILVGGTGADIFVAGDVFGIHYTGSAISIVTDYNYFEGDVVQLSGLGSGGYSYLQGNFGLGSTVIDTVIYYNNDPIVALADTPQFSWTFV